MKTLVVLLFALASGFFRVCSAEEKHGPRHDAEGRAEPTHLASPSEGAKAEAEAHGPASDFVLRLANESNFTDGWLGPVTYGLRASHEFDDGWELEGGWIRLHEPRSPALASFVDEEQLTARTPELGSGSRRLRLAATLWKNRMIDMYTNVAGLEATWVSRVSLTAGAYAGTATRDEAEGAFLGGQLGAAATFGNFEVNVAYMAGRIAPSEAGSAGLFRRAAIELSLGGASLAKSPVTFTLSAEDRFFSFGEGSVASDPQDALIFIAGVEIHPLGR